MKNRFASEETGSGDGGGEEGAQHTHKGAWLSLD